MKLADILDKEKTKIPIDVKRSGKWPTVRKQHLQNNPTCAVCGGTEKVEVHHIHPFHLHPELELDQNNLISLCEDNKDGFDCHLGFGHLGNFKSFNVDVVEDAKMWNDKIKNRPMGEIV